MALTQDEPKISDRQELITALKTAAEVEHLLCCEYLYSGWSVRRTPADFPAGSDEAAVRIAIDRATPWLGQLNLIARQEMEHLGLVANLMNAIGAEPHFEREEFPQPARSSLLGRPFGLDRFGVTSLQRFVWGERPSYLTPSFPSACYGLEGWNPKEVDLSDAQEMGIRTIEELYDEIGAAFATLPPDEIFVGDPDRQLGDVFSFRVKMLPVTNREDAAKAIHQILSEGEGMGMNPLTSACHFERLTGILTNLEEALEVDPRFDPALPVLTNPCVDPHPEDYPANVIHRPETLAVMHLFNGCYHAMLVMLKTFFMTYTASFTLQARGAPALFYGAFFPLMTMVVRPLGEILARMPAGDEYPGQNGGASFELPGTVDAQLQVDWYRDRLAALADRAGELQDAVPDRLRPDMQGVYQSLVSTRLHLEHIWQHGE